LGGGGGVGAVIWKNRNDGRRKHKLCGIFFVKCRNGEMKYSIVEYFDQGH